MSDTVKKYIKRRNARIKARMDAGEEGRWVTTENDHKIHISSEGVPDKGNPHVIKVMRAGRSIGGNDTNNYGGFDYVEFLDKKGFGKGKEKNQGRGYGAKYKPADTLGGYSKKEPTTSDQDFEKEGYKKNAEGRWAEKEENKEYGYGSGDERKSSKQTEPKSEEYDEKKLNDFLTGKTVRGYYGEKKTQAEATADEMKYAIEKSNEGYNMMDRNYSDKYQQAGAKMMDEAEDIFAEKLKSIPVGAKIVAENDIGEKMTIEKSVGSLKGYRIQQVESDGTIWRDSVELEGGKGYYSGRGAEEHDHKGESTVFRKIGEFGAKSITFEKSERHKK